MAKIRKNSYWTKPNTQALLNASDLAVYEALKVLYANQTADEQRSEVTNEDNGIGFSGTNAQLGTSLAKQILSGRELSQVARSGGNGQIYYARKIVLHHWGQFAQALNEEREALGLPTEAPKPAKSTPVPAAPAAPDRFTWVPGDLRKVDQDPLFDETPELHPQSKPAIEKQGHLWLNMTGQELFDERVDVETFTPSVVAQAVNKALRHYGKMKVC